MKTRREESYDKIFGWIKTNYPKVTSRRKSIIIDFEQASYNSLHSYFKNSTLYGWYFHLGQIIWRRVQILNFSKEFINNPQTKLLVKMILALSFVPSAEVFIVAARLKNYIIEERSLDVLMLFEWFQGEYLSNETSNKKISFWNVYERTQNNIPRTTNSLEGYHGHLNSLIDGKQSSIISFINELKSEQLIVENKILLQAAGVPPP